MKDEPVFAQNHLARLVALWSQAALDLNSLQEHDSSFTSACNVGVVLEHLVLVTAELHALNVLCTNMWRDFILN